MFFANSTRDALPQCHASARGEGTSWRPMLSKDWSLSAKWEDVDFRRANCPYVSVRIEFFPFASALNRPWQSVSAGATDRGTFVRRVAPLATSLSADNEQESCPGGVHAGGRRRFSKATRGAETHQVACSSSNGEPRAFNGVAAQTNRNECQGKNIKVSSR